MHTGAGAARRRREGIMRSLGGRGPFHRLGKFDLAIEDNQRILELKEASACDRAEARLDLGDIRCDMGDYDEAFAEYTEVLRIPDASGELRMRAHIGRGEVYWQQDKMGRGDP